MSLKRHGGTKAAKLGDKYSQYNLANCCYKGEGVSRNLKRAVMWYRKAAEQGAPIAIKFLPTAVASTVVTPAAASVAPTAPAVTAPAAPVAPAATAAVLAAVAREQV